VKRLRTIVTFALVAFWPLVAGHCLLETLPGLSFLQCVSDSPDSECDEDACRTVESDCFRTDDQQSLLAVFIAPDFLGELASVLNVTRLLVDLPTSVAAPPPELAKCWQFAFRAASPPRAPSFAS
jgi:hypothetical protein